ncbi:MAG: NADH-quinone oxidoreductase subunit NuoE family protein [Isosphaeraceae bacterium]
MEAKRTKMLDDRTRDEIRALFPRYPSKRAVTLPALHLVQERLRCVPYQAMAEIAEILEITPAEVHDTMSFYGFFPQAPIGDVRMWICRSLSCMLRGGDELLEHACHRRGFERGQTTPDGKLTVEYAECLGICDFAPAALADDGRIFGPLDEQRLNEVIEELKAGPVEAAGKAS